MYNGWTNYQTWRFVVDLDNNESSYNLWRNEIKDIYNKHKNHSARVEAFENFLRDMVEFFTPGYEVMNDFYHELLIANLEKINYNEIAESFVADYEVEVS